MKTIVKKLSKLLMQHLLRKLDEVIFKLEIMKFMNYFNQHGVEQRIKV